MQIETSDVTGTRAARFEDAYKRHCRISDSGPRAMGQLDPPALRIREWHDGPWREVLRLDRSLAQALLPLLQHFVETGRLPAGGGSDDTRNDRPDWSLVSLGVDYQSARDNTAPVRNDPREEWIRQAALQLAGTGMQPEQARRAAETLYDGVKTD